MPVQTKQCRACGMSIDRRDRNCPRCDAHQSMFANRRQAALFALVILPVVLLAGGVLVNLVASLVT